MLESGMVVPFGGKGENSDKKEHKESSGCCFLTWMLVTWMAMNILMMFTAPMDIFLL